MKKEKQLFNKAKQLYVNDEFTPEKIESIIDVSARQIFRWIKKYKWGEERIAKKEEAKEQFHKELIRIGAEVFIEKAILLLDICMEKAKSAEPRGINDCMQPAESLMRFIEALKYSIELKTRAKEKEEKKEEEKKLRIVDNAICR